MSYWDDEKLIKRFFDKVNKTEGCWEWTAFKCKKGYGYFGINGTVSKAHRVSFEIHYKRQIITGMMILHSCDNPKCVNPNHLREGTALDNSQDARERNRLTLGRNKGICHHNSKLTENDVLEIRKNTLLSQRQLALYYDVSQRLIWNIINGITWKHL